MSTAIGRPQPDEHAPYYSRYIERVPEGDLLDDLAAQSEVVAAAFLGLLPEKVDFRYAPGKWTPREMLGHMIDGERVMAFRALWFARADPNPLPGFEEDDWAAAAHHGDVPLADLVDEWRAARASHVQLFRHLPAEVWTRRGVANGQPVSVRALAYIQAGHARHHLAILEERYLSA